MKTNISEFCVEFSEALFPLAEALGDTVQSIEPLAGDWIKDTTEGLSNVRHRLEALINKVQGQEAYVLLFGPLKSGKSTLINAISGAYVSEVSSLPAYPCMVYLKYGAEPSYSVIRYSGKSESIESAEALKELLQKSHRTLSERIRAMDDFGEDFDPASHLPSAIRRVSVELPVEGLKESGTVLVDTPGLYSKMKFGYDYMTREFRDSAACAVFIVKTDNLFLEQVFSDFNDLLDQFSRVFVVVNIDTGKSDLCPDGSLAPSLESRDPEQIVRAFEVLTMSAPLRRAAESGRLHIYPVDLRSAAARRLREGPGATAGENVEADRFDEFQADLMSYLNSTDYLVEFISDSIRQSGKLGDEIIRHCSSENVERLQRRRDSLDEELAGLRDRASAAARVRDIDWHAQLAGPLQQQAEIRARHREEAIQALTARVDALATDWLNSDHSLQQLREEVGAVLADAVSRNHASAIDGLGQLAASAFGGAALEEDAANDLRALGLDSGAGQIADTVQSIPRAEITAPALDAIPMHRTLGDKLLFRYESSIRRKIMGDPDQAVPAGIKQKRLAGHAAEYIRQAAAESLTASLNRMEEEHYDPAAKSYKSGMAELAADRTAALAAQTEKQMNAIASEQSRLDTVISRLHQLAVSASDTRSAIAGLEDRHQQTVKDLQNDLQSEPAEAAAVVQSERRNAQAE